MCARKSHSVLTVDRSKSSSAITPHIIIYLFNYHTYLAVQMLEIVSEALQFNNVRHCVCVNRSKDFGPRGALAHFKAEPDLRVLLMPLHLGAEGLDLIVASRVFLLEPLVNRALETQAINRIHRIGQTRQAVVHKYVILGTVEQGIHERYRDLEDDNEMDNDQEQEQDIKNLGSHISLGESQQSHTPPRAQVKRFETPVSNKTVHSQESPNRKSAVVKAKGDAKAVSFHDIKSLLGGH